ncbi:MAG: ISAzo13 family transposase [Nitrososphaerota archaeon]|nr:ISAzo13 family transposase [Nitrososphaerota archaeon]
MNRKDRLALQTRIEAVLPTLNEYQRRRYLAAEAKAAGPGGISLVSRLSDITHPTIATGIKELNNPNTQLLPIGKSRKPGGGRKTIQNNQPNILSALKELVDPHTKGDPIQPMLWTNKSLRSLQKGLKEQGYNACYRVVGVMLKNLGYGLQADKKTLTVKPSHPDRNAQFEYLNTQTLKATSAGNPVLSIDAKKKEKLGNFKNNGQTYQKSKSLLEVLDHDFPLEKLGRATPFRVYDVFKNRGFVNVGLSAETSVFAVESLRRWWYGEGFLEYADAQEIVLTCDCGGSNGYRSRLWKFELQRFADEIDRSVRVLHFPPGTSKWNKIEHRLFSFISKNWQGIPLASVAVVVALIGATRTEKGLAVRCVLDESMYETGRVVSEEEYSSISTVPDDFHGEWNYTINPNKKKL